jgi:hypothetical protein
MASSKYVAAVASSPSPRATAAAAVTCAQMRHLKLINCATGEAVMQARLRQWTYVGDIEALSATHYQTEHLFFFAAVRVPKPHCNTATEACDIMRQNFVSREPKWSLLCMVPDKLMC